MNIPRDQFTVDYWYRCASDPDQSVRSTCQMMASALTAQEISATIAELRAQDYLVQRVIARTTCQACRGAGRIGHAPKGTRKATIARLPGWRLRWVDCAICHGDGYTASTDVELD